MLSAIGQPPLFAFNHLRALPPWHRQSKCHSRVDLMPLPPATGRAIAEYLRAERPTTANRQVFVRHVAPVGEPVSPNVVCNTVRDAYRRCGLPTPEVIAEH